MEFFKIINNKKGLSLIETFISSTMVLIIFISLVYFFINIESQIKDISQTSKAYKNTERMIQVILSHTESYQFYPEGTLGFGGVLDSDLDSEKTIYDLLPLAMTSKGEIKPVDECSTCARRLGVSLIPFSEKGTRGLFKAQIIGMEKIGGSTYNKFSNFKMLIPLI